MITLPTTLRLPRFKGAFRVTHRFTRPLGQGDFGSLAEDLFGLDSGALIGLGLALELMRGWQAGIYHQRPHDRVLHPVQRLAADQQARRPERCVG